MPSNISQYKYFSQYGEDYLLWNFFDYKKKGFYIDIGAFDGVHLSNSYSFEQQGWSGICIEPHPYYFPFCEKSRPNAICLNLACVCDNKVNNVDFYMDESGLLSSISGENREYVEFIYQKGLGLDFHGFTKERVKSMTLKAIIDAYVKDIKQIDFISIDVEGTELDVLEGFCFDHYSPRIFIIEANNEEARSSLNLFMSKQGYSEARRLGVNVFYVKNIQDYQKINSINVSCDIERTIHPKGEKYTLAQCITGYSVESQNTQTQLQNTQTQLQNTQTQLQNTQTQLQDLIVDYQNLTNLADQYLIEIDAMKSSKFWKMRQIWFKFKKTFISDSSELEQEEINQPESILVKQEEIPEIDFTYQPVDLNVGLEDRGFSEGVSLFTHGFGDVVSECIIKFKIWENIETQFFLENIQPGDTVIDLGANIGYYTCLAARLVGRKGRVFSFEPNDRNFALVTKNIIHNKLNNVFLMKAIVSNECGFNSLNENTSGDMGAHMAIPVQHQEFTQFSYHPKITLDRLEDLDINHVNFIKIDTQGSEPFIIDGGRNLINKNRHHLKMVVEFTPVWLQSLGIKPEDFLNELKSFGFEIFFIHPIKMSVEKLIDPKSLISTLMYPDGVNWPENVTFADLILLPGSK